jgi:ComF family protein
MPAFLYDSVMRRCAGGILDLLFPPRCHACHAGLPAHRQPQLCSGCREQVIFLSAPLCVCCGRQLQELPGPADRLCGDCLHSRPPFDSARSLVLYGPPVSTLLHRLKFQGDAATARVLAGLGQPETVACDLIIPVPLHPSRLRARGLNQSLVLARRFFPAERDKIVLNLLSRQKKTIAQTGLDGRQRRRNLKGAFSVTRPAAVQGRSILVIDDVFTTGTTLAECAQTLKAAGASRVVAWTVARAAGSNR